MTVRILVVDDHLVVRRGITSLLSDNPSWQVVGEASDGVEAIEKVEALNPDVVILDVTMPRMSGIEACRLIRSGKRRPEVLMVTQHDSTQMMNEALDAGARGYVLKSDAARDLLAAVEAVSQHKRFLAIDQANS